MLRWHRLCVVWTFPLLLYVIVTGAGIQLFDMKALLTHAPADDPDMLMMRQHINGTDNYVVVSAPDYSAPALPKELDYAAATQRAAALGRAAVPGAEVRLVELRMSEGKPAVHVQMDTRHVIFNLATGKPLPATDLPPAQPSRDFSSPRADWKFFHRFSFLSVFGTLFSGIAGIALSILLFTGLLQYWRVWRARSRVRRGEVFWRGGNRWRELHRWISVSATLPIAWMAVTGMVLSYDNLGVIPEILIHGMPAPFDKDFSSPMTDAELPIMARSALSAFAAHEPGVGVKVLRLRYFAGYPQGVIVADDANTSQHVFNTQTGAPMSMTEPLYPFLGFPLGWEGHQLLKRLHRGDAFGMTGRWLVSVGALGLLYLVVSGLIMYLQLRSSRVKAGMREFIWK